MTEDHYGEPCDYERLQAVDNPALFDAQNTIRRFPVGMHLTPNLLGRDDLLLSGWVGLGRSCRVTTDLIGVLLPGDRIGAVLDSHLCSAVALTPVSLASAEAETESVREIQHLIRQCLRTSHFSASDCIEDFFLETYERLEAVELASDWTFDFPLPQATLGNILGLSSAHVNRVIKQLQAESRIQIRGRTITLLEPATDGALSMTDCAI